MTEQPVDRAEPVRILPTESTLPEPDYSFLPRPRSKVIVRKDLLPALSVLSFISLLGLLVGWVWSLLAPPERVLVVNSKDNPLVPLLDESAHRFDDLAVFAMLGLGVGLIIGSAVWLLRERRGPVILLGAVLGSFLGAWLAMQVGVSFAGSHYAVTGTPNIGDVLNRAPILESGWVVLAQPLTMALAYGVLAAWSGRDDLGRRLG